MMSLALAANLIVPLAFLAPDGPGSLRAACGTTPMDKAAIRSGLRPGRGVGDADRGLVDRVGLQVADGDPALSLGLGAGLDVLEPGRMPASLHTLGMLAPSHYGQGSSPACRAATRGRFLFAWVLILPVLGLVVRAMLAGGAASAFSVEPQAQNCRPGDAPGPLLRQRLVVPANGAWEP